MTGARGKLEKLRIFQTYRFVPQNKFGTKLPQVEGMVISMINKLDGLVETVNYEPSAAFVVYHNTERENYPKHWHSAIEIVMPVKNSYLVNINDESYRLNEFDILIIPSGDLHELVTVTDIGERVILQFDLSIFKITDEYLNSSHIFLKPAYITPETSRELHSELKAILLSILEENDHKENCYEAGIIVKILSFAVAMAKKQTFEINHDIDFFSRKKEHITAFNKCIDYIGQHYKENLTLDHIAGVAGFSKYYFWRWFQQYSSLTFKAYLDQIRIKAAESLLMDLNVPITDVALESGFQSIATFNRVFKNMNKCTPTEYREYNRSSHKIDIKHDGKFSAAAKSDFLNAFSDTVIENKNFGSESSANAIIASQPPPSRLGCFPRFSDSPPDVDFPEPDIIRVSDVYYMVNSSVSSKNFLPGCPIMRSYDLLNWETICYVYDTLEGNSRDFDNSDVFSVGIRYSGGRFYVWVSADKTYLFTTDNLENNSWKRHDINGNYPNFSLFFNDNDENDSYIIYGENSLNITRFDAKKCEPLNNYKHKTIINDLGYLYNIRMYKESGYYYIFLTNRSKGAIICCRSIVIDSEYEIVMLPENKNSDCEPVTFVNAKNGVWYAAASVKQSFYGKTLRFFPMLWERGFPVVLFNEKADLFGDYANKTSGFICSDEFYQNDHPSFSINNREIFGKLMSKAGYYNDLKKLSVEILENTGFENGLNSWSSYNFANISIKNNDQNKDKYMLYVSGRRFTSSGPLQIITGKIEQGEKFKISACIKYTSGPKQHTFNISIINGTENCGAQVMASGKIDKGEWCRIEGTYTVPVTADTSKSCVFIESVWNDAPGKDDLMNFYVSHISMVKRILPNSRAALEGEFDYNGSNLGSQWQWNGVPNNNGWSLTERNGFLRLKNQSIANTLPEAVNILTQRVFGSDCSGTAALETENMKNGDIAGLAAFHKNFAYIGVKMQNGMKYIEVSDKGHDVFECPLTKNFVYFKLDFDFAELKMSFYYSTDYIEWLLAAEIPVLYDIDGEADGYRFALFNYAQEFLDGYVDFDFFRVDERLLRKSKTQSILGIRITTLGEITGSPSTELKLLIDADSPKIPINGEIHASFSVPEIFDVADVTFDSENISGDCSYAFKNNRLELKVCGGVSFVNKNSDRFASIKFRMKKYVGENTTVSVKLDYFYITDSDIVFKTDRNEFPIKINRSELKSPVKLPCYSNPLIDHKYGADPFALVYNGRVYIYLTSDSPEYGENGKMLTNTYSKINCITVISSRDLVNWTDHGEIHVAGTDGAAKWANHSWAPCAAFKNIGGKDKFFLYFANDASNIGVLTANSPLGPWSDPLGSSLIHRGIKGVENVTWCFDPAVLVDDDGSAYLYFGGGLPSENENDVLHPKTARVIKLGGDMTSVDGEAVMIDAPAFFEDSGIHKFGGKYYYSYCSNFAGTHPDGYPLHGEIAYMISDNPVSGFKYVGPLLKNPEHFFGVGGNNHHAIFEFNGKWYITYHAQTLGKSMNDIKGYRSPHINELEFYAGGNIKEVKANMEGVNPVAYFNPYERVSASTFAWSSGITEDIRDGDWLAVASADFGENGASAFHADIKSIGGGVIEIHLDSHDGEIIGILRANSKEKSWNVKSCDVKKIVGVHDIFIIFKGSDGTLFNLDYWFFSK